MTKPAFWALVMLAGLGVPVSGDVVHCNYAQLLANDLLRVDPEVVGVSIAAARPSDRSRLVIAGGRDEVGRPEGPEGLAAATQGKPIARRQSGRQRCDVALPLRATDGKLVGSALLRFKTPPGMRDADVMAAAVAVGRRWQLVIPNVETLFDPYTIGSAPGDTLAQRLTMEALARHPEFNVVAMHLTPLGQKGNIVAGINRPNFLGRPSDEIDTDTEHTGRVVMQVIPASHRMEVHLPLLSKDGALVGTICTVSLWFDERQAADIYLHSLAMRDELRPMIPDHAALFRP